VQISSLFSRACWTGDIALGRALAETGVALRTEYGIGLKQLCYQACMNGHFEMLKWLCQRFEPVDLRKVAKNALAVACLNGHMDVVQWLVARQEDKAKASKLGLLCAIGRGSVDMVAYLLDNGAGPLVSVENIIREACQRGDVDIAELLFERGVIDLTADYVFKLMLAWAAKEGKLEVVKWVCGKGGERCRRVMGVAYVSARRAKERSIADWFKSQWPDECGSADRSVASWWGLWLPGCRCGYHGGYE